MMKWTILGVLLFCCFSFADQEEKEDWVMEDLLGDQAEEVIDNSITVPAGEGLDRGTVKLAEEAGESLVRISNTATAAYPSQVAGSTLTKNIQTNAVKNMQNKILYKVGLKVYKYASYAGKAVGVLGAAGVGAAFTAFTGGSTADIVSSVATSIIADVAAIAIVEGILFIVSFSAVATAWLNAIPVIGTIIWGIEIAISASIATALSFAANAIINSTMEGEDDIMGMED